MDRFHQPSSIRILDTEYRSVGTGIYVGERLILTCEHVVAEAQGRSRSVARPDQPVRFVFAYADGSPGAAKPEAKLLRRWPDAGVKTQGKLYDVALLEITDPDAIPTGAAAAPLSEDADQPSQQGHVFGFAKEPGRSVEVKYGLQGTDGLVPLDWGGSEAAVAGGHSGSPVWNTETKQVMGMVIEIDAESSTDTSLPKIAYMLPVRLMKQALAWVHPGLGRSTRGIRQAEDDLRRDLTALFREPISLDPNLAWSRLIDDCRLSINPRLASPGSDLPEDLARWVLGHTLPNRPIAYALIYLVHRRLGDSLDAHATDARRLGDLAGRIQDHWRLNDAQGQAMLADMRRRIDAGPGYQALVLWLQVAGVERFGVTVFAFRALGDAHEDSGEPIMEVENLILPAAPGARGGGRRRNAADTGMPLGDLVAWVLERYKQQRFEDGIEVVLPEDLLMDWHLAPESWTCADAGPLGLQTLVLRSHTAFVKPNEIRVQHWNAVIKRALCNHIVDASMLDRNGIAIAVTKKGKVAVLELDRCDARKALEHCCDADVTVAVWMRRCPPCNTKLQDVLRQAMGKRRKVPELKERLLDLRERYHDDQQHPFFRIGLLMDNPYRVRARQRGAFQSPIRARAG